MYCKVWTIQCASNFVWINYCLPLQKCFQIGEDRVWKPNYLYPCILTRAQLMSLYYIMSYQDCCSLRSWCVTRRRFHKWRTDEEWERDSKNGEQLLIVCCPNLKYCWVLIPEWWKANVSGAYGCRRRQGMWFACGPRAVTFSCFLHDAAASHGTSHQCEMKRRFQEQRTAEEQGGGTESGRQLFIA